MQIQKRCYTYSSHPTPYNTKNRISGNQHTTPPNGALSLKSTTKSSTLLRYLPNNPCFSLVVLVSPLSLSVLFRPPTSLLKAPASLLGLRCNIAGTDGVAPALGIEGVSG